MLVLAGIPVPTEATLPSLTAHAATVYLAAGGMLGVMIGLLAHFAYRDGRMEAWRRLRFAGAMLAVSLFARTLTPSDLPVARLPLAAAFSVVDLSVLILLVVSCLSLVPQPRRCRARNMLGISAVAAVFLGLLGGDLTQSILARNVPAAGCHLLTLISIAAILLRESYGDLRDRRRASEEHEDAAEREKQRLEANTLDLRHEVETATARAQNAVDLARDAGRRARLLEHLIASSVDLHGRRGQQDLYDHAVALVAQLFGFQQIRLYQWSDSLAAFSVQATHGIAVEDARRLGAEHLDRAGYDELAHPRYRVSDSYLVPPATAAWPPTVPVDEAAWPDGQRLVVPLTDPAGVVHGFVDLSLPEAGRAPDLLRIRYLELLVRQLAAVLVGVEMRERLATCRAELSLADERLQSLGELRSNFVANVSHELRTPLTSIIGYSEMLRDRGEDMSSEMRREFLAVIHEQGQQFKEIINDLLELDRMEDTSARLERTECDLGALARRMSEDWRQQAEQHDLDLIVDTGDGREISLEADPVLCQQLLSHLVDNAIKFTPDGGAVSVRLREQGTAVRIEVKDSGIGIPEDKLHTVFEQFYQVDGSSTRKIGGQGVGLSLCQDIVSWHDGRIWAENVRDGGARLTVLLPRRPHVVLPDPPAPVNPVFQDPRLYLQRLIHWVGDNLGVNSVVLMRAIHDAEHLTVLAATGLSAGQVQDLRLARSVGLAGKVWTDGVSRLMAPDASDPLLSGDAPALAVALMDEGEPAGVVVVRGRADGRDLTDDDRLLLEAMSPRLVHLLARYDEQEAGGRDFVAVQTALRVTTRVGTLSHADVAGVCQEICLATARRLDLSEDDIRDLAFALQYYDVGLGSVPPHLLNKVDALTEAERVALERHVQVGLVTLAPLCPSPKVRQTILHHHENFDGTGYPKGLSGEAIPLGSRLVALTDSLRALLQRRPWRPAVPLTAALAEIQALAGTRYCPRLTALFLEEAEARSGLIDELRQHADDGEDLKRPAVLYPVPLQRN